MGDEFRELRYEVDAGVATITIDRAEQRNTVTYAVLDELLAAFAAADASPDVRVVVVTGAGEFFSAGTDLSVGAGGFEVGTTGFKPLRGGTRDVGGELALRIFALTKPVIAAINGTAVGIGVTMVLPMDIRIGAHGSRFALPFVRRGIIPESCATWFLPRIVGIATAVDWAVTGRFVSADEALAAGLVRELVPAEQVLPRALEIAAEITTTSAVSVALTRQLLWRQLGAAGPMSANRLESQALLALGTMADAVEGVNAYRERRAATFPLRVPDDLPAFYPWWPPEQFD